MLHPSPQRARPSWIDLSGQWGFAFDDAEIGLDQGWYERPECFDRTIEVPYPPESKASGIGDPAYHPVVWYRRTFRGGDLDLSAGRRLLMHFGAVDYEADVWVNGQHVGRHEGGHTSFTFDVTHALRNRDEHDVVVRAVDRPRDLTQPRGKQFWEPEPRRIWYHRTTGIWQPVWLETVGPRWIEDLRWTPDVPRGLVGLRIRLNEEPRRPMRLHLRLTLRGDVLADDQYLVRGRESLREVGLEPVVLNMGRQRLLWSPKHPNLVDAEIRLEDEDGTVYDEVRSYVGLRSVEATDGLFLLNGVPAYLRLVLAQNYWPDSHLAPPGDEGIRKEVEAVKSLGFNGIRIHQKVEDPRFLYMCDKLGLFVWSEMANAYVFSDQAVERFTREWMDVLNRDANHPSIITWVPFNESWGVPNLPGDPAQRALVRSIYELTHAIDPTRPVIGNDGWEHIVSDIWGIHDYALEGSVIRERYESPEATERTLMSRPQHHRVLFDAAPRSGQPIVLSEFGGISYAPQPGTPWFGYGSVTDRDGFLALYEDLVQAVLDSPAIAGFCYTQLTDTEQETNGLLNADRSSKLDVERVAAITSGISKSMPGDVVLATQEASVVTAYGGAGG